jgi:hypothetical protein
MKMFLTGSNRNSFHSDNIAPKVMLHFDRDCNLLANSHTGIFDIEFPIALTFEQVDEPFQYEGKTIVCCSSCKSVKFRKEQDVSFKNLIKEVKEEREQKIIDAAQKMAKKLMKSK